MFSSMFSPMFSVTATRFIASLAMTLLLWLTCNTGAVADEPVNPGDCNDPWECIFSPIIGGTITGPYSLCPGITGSWSISDTVTPGRKERCEKPRYPGVVNASGDAGKIDWVWKVKGVNNFSADGVGNSFDKSYSEPGEYKITWKGSAFTDDKGEDKKCDNPYDVEVTFSFTVNSSAPTAALTSIVIKQDPLCIDEEGDGISTIGDQSPCDPGPYMVKWKIESDDGPQNLQFTPSSGEVSLTFKQSADLTFKVKAGAGAKGGTAKIKITATVNGVDQTSSGKVDIIGLKSVTHNAPEYQPWTPGATVAATAVVEGELGSKEILYEAINVHTGAVVGSLSVASTSATLPINQPGRYRLQVTLCDKAVNSNNTFVLWEAEIHNSDTTIVWDTLKDVPNPEEWAIVEAEKALVVKVMEDMATAQAKIEKEAIPNAKKATESLGNTIKKANDDLLKIQDETTTERNRLRRLGGVQATELATLKGEANTLPGQIDDLKIKVDNLTDELRIVEEEIRKAQNKPKLLPELRDQAQKISDRLARASQKLEVVTNRLAYVTKRIGELGPLIAKTATEFSEAVAKLDKVREQINALAPIIKNLKALAGPAEKIISGVLKAAKAALIVVPVYFGVKDIFDATKAETEYNEAVAKLLEKVTESDNYLKRYNTAMDNWLNNPQKRETSAQVVTLTLNTTPGDIPKIRFLEYGEYITYDPTIPNAEGRPWEHFTFIGGNRNSWDDMLTNTYRSSAGEHGYVEITVHAMGNIGNSKIYAQIDNSQNGKMDAKITSVGSDREKLQEIMNTKLNESKANLLLWSANIEKYVAYLSAATFVISIVGILVGTFKFAAFALAAVLLTKLVALLAIAAIVLLAIALVLKWLASSDYALPDSVTKLFPSNQYSK